MWKITRLAVPGFDEVHRLEGAQTVAFVALHALIAGRCFGGVRIRAYDSEQSALDDALKLAQAMSRKVVLTGIRGGGGKSVLIAPSPARRAEAVGELGTFIESLGGRYHCGADLGFTAEDDAVLRRATRHVACGDLSHHTSESVLAAMSAAIDPKIVVVQGVGAVGRPIAAKLAERGVRVITSDVRPVAGFESVAPDAAYDVVCDVFAPCAMGGVLDARTIPRLRCRVVCGGANNPFAQEGDADALHRRGITYVPDFIANSGATIHGASRAIGEIDRAAQRMANIAPLTREVLARADREGRSPHFVAVAMADQRIAEWRRER